MFKGNRVCLAALVAVLACQSLAFGKKGGNGGGQGNRETYRTAGAFVLADRVGDAVISDGAPYVDENRLLPYGIICTDGADINAATCSVPYYRSAYLQMGVCVSENCEDPFNGAMAGSTSGAGFGFYVWGFDDSDGVMRFPQIGETMTTLTDDLIDGHIGFRIRTNGEDYKLTWHGQGQLMATGYDDDGDGVRDRVTFTASAGAIVDLERLEYAQSNRGNEPSRYWTQVSTYTNMPISVHVLSLDYERLIRDLQYGSYWGPASVWWEEPLP